MTMRQAATDLFLNLAGRPMDEAVVVPVIEQFAEAIVREAVRQAARAVDEKLVGMVQE